MARAGSSKSAGLESLRFVRSCSASLPVELGNRIEAFLGVPVLEAYGMTEAAHQMASNPLPPRVRKMGTVGPGTGVGISIIDDGGKHLPAGERGQVVIQGPNVVREYESNPEATAASFVGGWFRTGDQGVLDSEGYLRLTGRLKEMINRGGEKISPLEIDDLLLLHPKVSEAVTFGVAHPGWGEEVAAAVVLKEAATDGEIIAWCKDRIADFKAPKKIYVVDAIPRTATGKIQRLNVAKTLAG
jgi:acyl-CoA synthetase (AMP-forming)/AMP-acid ligase II